MDIITSNYVLEPSEWTNVKAKTKLNSLCCFKNKFHKNYRGESLVKEYIRFKTVPTHKLCLSCCKTEHKLHLPTHCKCNYKVLYAVEWYSNVFNWKFQKLARKASKLCCAVNHAEGDVIIQGIYTFADCKPHSFCTFCYLRQVEEQTVVKTCECSFGLCTRGANDVPFRVRI